MNKTLIAVCTLSTLLSTLQVSADPLAECQARFGVITGDVGLLPQGAKEWIVPHDGLPLEPGDHIRTGDDGRVELIMSDNAVWLLEPESDVLTEHIDANSGRLNLSSGTLMGKVDSERAAGTSQRWEFNTPAAVAAIHGTEFGLECSKKEGTYLAVFEGTVDLEPAETASGLQPPVSVPTGRIAVAKRGRLIQLMGHPGPREKSWAAALPAFRRRVRQIQNTWSPYTPAVRLELRRKFVAPTPKAKSNPPHPAPKPRHKKSSEYNSY